MKVERELEELKGKEMRGKESIGSDENLWME